jgi:hypothetical protein
MVDPCRAQRTPIDQDTPHEEGLVLRFISHDKGLRQQWKSPLVEFIRNVAQFIPVNFSPRASRCSRDLRRCLFFLGSLILKLEQKKDYHRRFQLPKVNHGELFSGCLYDLFELFHDPTAKVHSKTSKPHFRFPRRNLPLTLLGPFLLSHAINLAYHVQRNRFMDVMDDLPELDRFACAEWEKVVTVLCKGPVVSTPLGLRDDAEDNCLDLIFTRHCSVWKSCSACSAMPRCSDAIPPCRGGWVMFGLFRFTRSFHEPSAIRY